MLQYTCNGRYIKGLISMNVVTQEKLMSLIEEYMSEYLEDPEFTLYLKEKLEKLHNKAKQHNVSDENVMTFVKSEIPTFLENYESFKKTFKKQEEIRSTKLGISINFQLIDLFEVIDTCQNDEEFIKMRDEYFQSLSSDPRFQGFNYIFNGLDSITLEEIKQIRHNILENVDCITPEWSGKMRMIVDQRKPLMIDDTINPELFDFKYLDKFADFARDNNMKIRLHTIVWHTQFPQFLKEASKEETLLFLDKYMEELSIRYGDVAYAVDVLNEIASDDPGDPLRNSPWRDKLGDDYYIEILKIAKKNFPDISVAYNEYGEENPVKRGNVIELVNRIKKVEQEEGITLLDVLGIQAHYNNFTTDTSIKSAFEEYSLLDKELQVTELDVGNQGQSNDIDFQANRVYRTVMESSCLANIKLMNMWGVSSKISWKSEKVNTFLDDKGEISMYSQRLVNGFSEKSKERDKSKIIV